MSEQISSLQALIRVYNTIQESIERTQSAIDRLKAIEVTNECKLPRGLRMALVANGKDPCEGCNHNGICGMDPSK